MHLSLAFIFSLLLSPLSYAGRAPCGVALYKRNVWQAQVLPIDRGERCFLKMSPQNPRNKYRSYNFSSDGQVMIFVSQGSSTSQTAAQTYYIWPMKDIPRISKDLVTDKVTEVKSAAGDVWVFDKDKEDLIEIQGCEVVKKDDFNWKKESGVDIKKCSDRLLVNVGYTQGKQSTESPDQDVKIRDSNGLECKLKTADLIDYSHGNNSPKPRFDSNVAIYTFLSQHAECNKLNLAVLLK